MAEATPTYCLRDPAVETNLRCGKCGDLICPDCLVQTDVGSRCPDCAQIRTPPMFAPTAAELGRAAAAGFGSTIGLAIVYVLVAGFFLRPIGLPLSVVALGGIGWLSGEVVYRASGYKQSQGLQWIAGFATFLAFAVVVVVFPTGVLGATVGLVLGMLWGAQKVRPPRR